MPYTYNFREDNGFFNGSSNYTLEHVDDHSSQRDNIANEPSQKKLTLCRSQNDW